MIPSFLRINILLKIPFDCRIFKYLKNIDEEKVVNTSELNVAEKVLLEILEKEKLAEASWWLIKLSGWLSWLGFISDELLTDLILSNVLTQST